MNRIANSLADGVLATMDKYIDDLSGAERRHAALAAVFSEEELKLIRYALAEMTTHCDFVVIEDLSPDAYDINNDEVMLEQRLRLEAEYHRLAALFGDGK